MINVTLFVIIPLCIIGLREIISLEFKDDSLVKYTTWILTILWLLTIIFI
jgi:hypothetical protein